MAEARTPSTTALARGLTSVVKTMTGVASVAAFIYPAFLLDATYSVFGAAQPQYAEVLKRFSSVAAAYRQKNGTDAVTELVVFRIKKDLVIPDGQAVLVVCGVMPVAPASAQFTFQETEPIAGKRCFIAKNVRPLVPDLAAAYVLAAGGGAELHAVLQGPTIANRQRLVGWRWIIVFAAPALALLPFALLIVGRFFSRHDFRHLAAPWHYLYPYAARYARAEHGAPRRGRPAIAAWLNAFAVTALVFVLADILSMFLIERPSVILNVYASGACDDCTVIRYHALPLVGWALRYFFS